MQNGRFPTTTTRNFTPRTACPRGDGGAFSSKKAVTPAKAPGWRIVSVTAVWLPNLSPLTIETAVSHHHNTRIYRQNGRFPIITSREFTCGTAVSPTTSREITSRTAVSHHHNTRIYRQNGRFPIITSREFT
ncbi:MAG: hypothetical protein GY805_37045, partial [Chloroflexi bacterium]|nr:hypothetical protein [Chloroflexota bacterium]